ncbi:MAG: G3E family GTPase [Candidatus Azotimanducaceae bacterium]|jgi:G3E family GTPase
MAKYMSGIGTNIITGFLGSGKTTAILELLAKKPANERWAVLVNEFGEVGIDGGLLGSSNDSNIFIREVPGGCMCCAAGLPMQMALSMLLARARPDRLIIEPTGLGHPFEVANALSAEHNRDLLNIQATLTMVDARKIADERYTGHATFNEQLDIADVVVASKSDLYGPDDLGNLRGYLDAKNWLQQRELIEISRGVLSPDWLRREGRSWPMEDKIGVKPPTVVEPEPAELDFPPEGFIRLSNKGEGFASHGWIFQQSFVFSRLAVSELIQSVQAERVKALLRTDEGDLGFNYAGDGLEELPLRPLDDNRIEVIAAENFRAAAFESQLLSAMISK